MPSLRLQLPDRREFLTAGMAGLAIGLVAYAGAHKLGTAGLAAPLLVILLLMAFRRPLAMTMTVTALVIVAEGPTFGIFQFASHLYDRATVLNVLVALMVGSVGFDLIRHRRRLQVDRTLGLIFVTLLLAMIAGIITGHAKGIGLGTTIHKVNILAYLLLVPLAASNLDISRQTVQRVLAGAMALAIAKAFLGMVEVVGHLGLSIEGASTLTYYEPTANWVIMIALFAVCGALVAKVRLPAWVWVGAPLLLTSLVLSYRRSFWIAGVLGLIIVVVVGLAPGRRRILAPIVALVLVAVWFGGTVSVQSRSPIVKRVESLTPTNLEQSAQASYRNDERSDVLRAISEHPLTGLGINVPWEATPTPLSVEHEEGRLYVHFDALFFWLKMGILGLLAYVGFIVGGVGLAWRVWRRSVEPIIRLFGLASLAGWLGLIAIEATASFTGVDPRFTVVIAVQAGLLALLVRSGSDGDGDAQAASGAASPRRHVELRQRRLPISPEA